MTDVSANPLLGTKKLGAVTTIRDISFDIEHGEIVSPFSDNGAGKSTLVKIISGLYTPTSGQLRLEGKMMNFNQPSEALHAGIETVYQHLALIEQSDVTDNFLKHKVTADMLPDLPIRIPASTQAVRRMSSDQQQATVKKSETSPEDIVTYITGAKV